MKNLFIGIFCILFSFPLLAEDKTIVGLTPFGYAQGVNQPEALMIYNHVAEILSNNEESLELLDRNTWGDVIEERTRQDGSAFRKSKTYQQGISAGAEALIKGYIYEASREMTESTNEEKIVIKMGLDIIDINTGQTINSEVFAVQGVSENGKIRVVSSSVGLLGGVANTFVDLKDALSGKVNDAFSACLTSLDKDMISFFQKEYPGKYKESSKFIEKVGRVIPTRSRGKHFSFAVRGDTQIAINGKKKDGVKKTSRFILVVEIPYEEKSSNGSIMTGVEREIVAQFKLDEHKGDQSILTLKGSDGTIDQLIEDTRYNKTAARYISEPKFYVMFHKDLKI